MKLIFVLCLLIGSAHALDYDPQFQIKHRFNRHAEAKAAFDQASAQKAQRMEAAPAPKTNVPATRKTK